MTDQADRLENAGAVAIAAIILAVLIPPAGVLLGAWSLSRYQRAGTRPGQLAMAAVILGLALTAAWVIAAIVLAGTVGAGNGLPACDPSNPAWPDCTTIGP